MRACAAASFCDVLSNLNPENTAFRNRMDHLNRYCRANRLASVTRRELREYLIRAKHVQVGESQKELVRLMSPKLQGELSLQINGPWLTSVRFLRKIEMACAIRIALALQEALYVPTELLVADSMYHITRGTVVYRGSVLVGGSIWGEDCILRRVDYRSRPARALTYAQVSQISGEILADIINDSVTVFDSKGEATRASRYPTATKKLRWERIRLSLLAEARKVINAAGSKARWDMALGQMEMDFEKVNADAQQLVPSPVEGLAARAAPPKVCAASAVAADGTAAADGTVAAHGTSITRSPSSRRRRTHQPRNGSCSAESQLSCSSGRQQEQSGTDVDVPVKEDEAEHEATLIL